MNYDDQEICRYRSIMTTSVFRSIMNSCLSEIMRNHGKSMYISYFTMTSICELNFTELPILNSWRNNFKDLWQRNNDHRIRSSLLESSIKHSLWWDISKRTVIDHSFARENQRHTNVTWNHLIIRDTWNRWSTRTYRNTFHNNYRNRHIVQNDITRNCHVDCIIVTFRSYVNSVGYVNIYSLTSLVVEFFSELVDLSLMMRYITN